MAIERTFALTAVLLFCAMGAGCSSFGHKQAAGTPIQLAETELPESQLLDVGIRTFEAGTDDEIARAEAGIPPAVREAESRFMPVHLKNTMQRTGHWGAVRVIPARSDAIDVLVEGTILRSDGEQLELEIRAYDATGRRWFKQAYTVSLEAKDYADNLRGEHDPFQDLYNAIANDLARFKASLDAKTLIEVRQVAELRFAAGLAPDAFESYLAQDGDGVWHVNRLPAREDPMLARVRRIREREYMLVDTVTNHYDHLYASMWDPYLGWRRSRAEEAAALREVERKALLRKVLGGALILGGVAAGVMGDSKSAGNVGTVMVVGGAMVMKSGFDMGSQVEIHEDAIRELGVSFEAEVKPLVVEVEGETVELTGSAEAQFDKWRQLLERIYFTETGLGGVTPGTPPASN